MLTWLALMFLLTLVIALILFLLARQQQSEAGLPTGARVVYADTGAWQRVTQPLVSMRYGLSGKPDYIVEERGKIIPIEVKPNRVAPAPYTSDMLQLAAYALLVEENWSTTPTYGLLKYRDRVFRIEFNDALRARLLAVLEAMQRDLTAREVARSHAESARCRACGYRDACGQALA